jgi:hypothetical protein
VVVDALDGSAHPSSGCDVRGRARGDRSAGTDDPSFSIFFASLLALVPRLEPASARYRAPINVRSWETTGDRLRRSLGIGGAIAVGVLLSSSIATDGSVLGSVLVALVLGGLYTAISEWVQRGFAKARDTLRLPERMPETADAPPPVVGTTWDWSRAALVAAIGLVTGGALSVPEEDLGAGIGGGLAVVAALSPFVWFGKSSLAAPFQHQREVFRANLRYSLLRGALFSGIVPAIVSRCTWRTAKVPIAKAMVRWVAIPRCWGSP